MYVCVDLCCLMKELKVEVAFYTCNLMLIQSFDIAEIHNQGLTSCKPYKETATQTTSFCLALALLFSSIKTLEHKHYHGY